jgi:hypothetical protein
MEELIKQTEQRIKDLEEILEQGRKLVRELNYQRDLQQIANNTNENEIDALRSLLEEQNTPQPEQCYTGIYSASR